MDSILADIDRKAVDQHEDLIRKEAASRQKDELRLGVVFWVLMAFVVGYFTGGTETARVKAELKAAELQMERLTGENNNLIEAQVALSSPDSEYSFARLRARLFWTMPKSAPELAPSFNKEPSPGFPTLEILGVNYDTASR